MAQKDIYSVIEDLLEADMTKKDTIKNPQNKDMQGEEIDEKMIDDDAFTYKIAQAAMDGKSEIELDGKTHKVTMSKDQAAKIVKEMDDKMQAEADEKEDEESMEEDATQATNSTTKANADGNDEPKSGQDSKEAEADQGPHDLAADNAGDTGGDKGKNASDASPEAPVIGKEKGAALDGGGDKDVGSIDGKKGKPSDASASVEADKAPHDQEKDQGLGESEEKDDEEKDEMAEDGQDTSVQKNANDDELPPEDKETLGSEQTTSSEVEADEKDHDQSKDPIDTATKANPKQKVAEESDEEEEMAESQDVENDKNSNGIDDRFESNVVKAAKECMEGTCSEEEACEKYECSMSEMKGCMEAMKEAKLDKDEVETLKSVAKKHEESTESDDEEEMTESDDMDAEDEEEMSEGELPDALKKNAEKMKKGEMQKEDEDEEDEEESMNEEFRTRAAVIFETAVNEKASVIREEMQEEFDTKLEEEKAALNEKVSEYLDYAVQEWMQENALEIRYSLRTEIAENFISGLKGLFEESYIEIPEEEVSVVDELTETVETFKEQIEDQESQLTEMRSEILSFRRQEIVDEISEDLTETQKIRLEKLSESVEAEDIDEFRFKVEELKEGYFDPTSEQPFLGSLTEEIYGGVAIEEDDDSSVSQYAKFLSKTVLK